MKKSHSPLWFGAAICAVAAALFVVANSATVLSADAVSSPRVALEARANQSTATFAGGCFWSMNAIFSQLKGVESAQPGYAGGTTQNPTYETVCSGDTGHAETINIIYDPKVISYDELLKVFLMVHDPTQLNRQGADVGTNYRSEIFYRNDDQKKIAQAALAKPASSYGWDGKIVTKLSPYKKFYRAESYHLDYYDLHPNAGYCQMIIAPKIAKFQKEFKDHLK